MDANALSSMLGGGAGAGGGLGGLDMQQLQNMMGGMGGGFPAVPAVANPEEAYAEQLTQLRVSAVFKVHICNTRIAELIMLMLVDHRMHTSFKGEGHLVSFEFQKLEAEQVACTNEMFVQEMGFYDQAENIRVLQTTGGNVQAAVDRLLNQP